MVGTEKRKEVLTLTLLQSRIAKDSVSYRDEFLLRLRHFDAQCALVAQNPESASDEFAELATFLANTASKYTHDVADFGPKLVGLLENYAAQFSQDVRRRLCVAAMTLRARGLLPPARLLELLLGLLRVPDRQLRATLLQRIVADVRAANRKGRNQRLNGALQNVLAKLSGEGGPPARLALGLLVELYRRGVWADARTVNIVADTAVCGDSRLAATALQFFVAPSEAAAATGVGKPDADSDSETDAVKALRRAVLSHARAGKHKTKKMRKLLEAAERKPSAKDAAPADVAALRLLHDPQTFVEKLLARCRGGSCTWGRC
jgi:protein SDA1